MSLHLMGTIWTKVNYRKKTGETNCMCYNDLWIISELGVKGMGNKKRNRANLRRLEFLILCKQKDFHQAGYTDVDFNVISEYLVEVKWKNRVLFLHEMAADIQNLTHAEVMDYLRLEDIFHAKEESLHQLFNNLI